MAPADFNALCEGYENKKRADREYSRQQTFMIVSPYMDKKKGDNYNRFKRNWPHPWEQAEAPEIKTLTQDEAKAIIERHKKYIKPKKK